MPDAKTLWRNVIGEGAPISVQLNGIENAGHGVADRDASGHVTVHVNLGAS